MKIARQRGFTLVELVKVIAFFAFWGLVAAVAIHFIIKFW